MRGVKLAQVCIALGVAIVCAVYLSYLARITYTGYCHSSGKYLAADEKIKIAVAEVLKRYPPPVIQTQVEPNVWRNSFPANPIHYRGVEEFLMLNPDCCKVYPTEKFMEGGTLTLIEKLTGTATSVIEVKYLVRYRSEDGKVESIKTTDQLHITNCGTPGRPWSPY